MENNVPDYGDILKMKMNLRKAATEYWYANELFTVEWWFLLISSFLPWYIWWKLLDRQRIFEIACYGLIWSIVAITIDGIGTDMILWGYPKKLFSMIPPLLPADIAVVPVSFMLVYQYFGAWKSYTAASLALSFIYAYIIEPIFIRLDLFEMHSWKHIYSLICFFILAMLIKLLVMKMKKAAEA